MKKGFYFLCGLIACCASTAEATPRPVATLSAGSDIAYLSLNQNISFMPPSQNSYVSSHHYNSEFIGGLFLGLETPSWKNLSAQLGLGYYQRDNFNLAGIVYHNTSPATGNSNYQYQIKSQRLLLETKIMANFQKLHPFITAGLGQALNSAQGYNEVPLSPSLSTPTTFSNRSYHSFTYALGLGLEGDLNKQFRLGATYRYIDLGKAGLGAAPNQIGTNGITYNHLHANEFLVQISYLA